MKIFSFAFAIAFILQDYGTLQVDQIDALPPTEQLRVFKEYYAYELVNAAVERFRENKEIMQGGSECVRLIKRKDTSLIDAILALMSIANDYYEPFEAIGKSDTSPTQTDAGLMKRIRDVLFIIQGSLGKFPQIDITDHLDALKLQHKQDQSECAPASSAYDANLESAKNCYRALGSINYEDNEQFFEHLTNGFEDVGEILLYDREEHAEYRAALRKRLDTIIQGFKKLSWKTPDSEYFHNGLALFVEWLNENSKSD